MKLVFVSNYFNHHQSALCEMLFRQLDQFAFISTGEMRQERRDLGYGMEEPSFVLSAHKGDRALCESGIRDADVVIVGAAPEELVAERIRSGRLTFRYTERILKNPVHPLKYCLRYVRLHMRNPAGKPVYLLCAGAYTSGDFREFGLFRNKAYKWGYFPKTKHYDDPRKMIAQKKRERILWAGRMIDWKHPEAVLQIARRLKEEGLSFEIVMIGSGEETDRLNRQIREWKLENCVCLPGSMKPDQVRTHMERAGIFLATSDKREGWGAVINEAMNSGCAVVASHEMGSVPYLIEHEKNGLIYKSGDIDMLYENVKALLLAPEKQELLGRQAYETIATLWNSEVAAQRLIALSERILAGEKYPVLYANGPCSKAEVLKDDWM